MKQIAVQFRITTMNDNEVSIGDIEKVLNSNFKNIDCVNVNVQTTPIASYPTNPLFPYAQPSYQFTGNSDLKWNAPDFSEKSEGSEDSKDSETQDMSAFMDKIDEITNGLQTKYFKE